MATHTYFDFTLRTSFPKKGMHTLQKDNRGVSVSQQQAKTIRDYYMYEGNEACKRLISDTTLMGVIESITKKNGLQAIYVLCKGLVKEKTITAEIVIDFLKSWSAGLAIYNIFPISVWDVGDIVIASVNYRNINDIYKRN